MVPREMLSGRFNPSPSSTTVTEDGEMMQSASSAMAPPPGWRVTVKGMDTTRRTGTVTWTEVALMVTFFTSAAWPSVPMRTTFTCSWMVSLTDSPPT